MLEYNPLQRTDEWRAQRRGKVTASRVADVTARTKSGWGAARANYMAELVCERMTGTTQEGFTNWSMLHGIQTEPEALVAYSFFSDNDVEAVGFIDHPTVPTSGASPDGHVGTDGSVEIKCPNTNTHIETLLTGLVPEKYMVQMQWQMACSERRWCDFVSYDPRMPEELKLFVLRVERNDEEIATLEQDVRDFLAVLEEQVDYLVALSERRAA